MRAWAWVQTGRVSLRSFGARSRRCGNARERDAERRDADRVRSERKERERIRETLERRGRV